MAGAAETERKSLTFAELDLEFGREVYVIPNPADKDRIYACELVGCLAMQSIIIGPSSSTGAMPRFVDGQRIIVQVKLAGGIALFTTTVLFQSLIPTLMVYLDYPNDVRFKQVRGALRVDVALPVLVFNKTRGDSSAAIVGKIVDISITGAGLELYEPLGDVGDTVQIKGKFQVGTIQRVLSIEARIRGKGVKSEHFLYGIEFQEGDEDKLIVLMGFTYHAMAFGHIQNIR
jgi:c-di-GMP-binding flagellar brake protein YcgR